MKKLIFTLFFCLVALSYTRATVIFDPATYPSDKLKAGMTVVTIEGETYLQVIVDGWNSALDIPKYTLLSGQTKVQCTYKYKSAALGADSINGNVQIIDYITKEPASWDPNTMVNVATGMGDKASNISTLKKFISDINAKQVYIHAVQFSGQRNYGDWGAQTGDTIWVSKIEVFDPANVGIAAVFNPATVADSLLKTGMTKVTIGGKSYLQVILDGWNSSIDIPPYPISSSETKVKTTFKYKPVTLGADSINANVQIIDTANKEPASWDPNTMVNVATGMGDKASSFADFKQVISDINAKQKFVHTVQFSGQQNFGSWGAQTGDTIWVGNVEVFDPAAAPTGPFDLRNFTGEVPAGTEVVEIGGVKYWKVKVNAWNTTFTVAAMASGENNTMKVKLMYDKGDYTGTEEMQAFYQLFDEAGTGVAVTASSTDPTDVKNIIKQNTTYNTVQLAIQEKTNWGAIVGGYVLVSTVELVKEEATPSVAKNTYNAPYAGLDDYIGSDGILENDEYWSVITAADINRQAMPKDETPKISDSKGTLKAAWDEYYLYLLVEADDPNVITNDGGWNPADASHYSGYAQWENDGAEIYIDIKNRHNIGQSRISAEQYQLRFNVGRPDADTAGVMSTTAEAIKEEVVWGLEPTANGWLLEVQLPWPNLCNKSIADADIASYVSTEIKIGKKIAFEVSVINADAKDHRVSIMNWANDTKDDQAYYTNEYYGELVLAERGAVSVNEKQITKALVYPNPATSSLRVYMEGLNTIEIISSVGSVVSLVNAESSIQSVDISSLPGGVYILKATNAKGEVSINKFVKK